MALPSWIAPAASMLFGGIGALTSDSMSPEQREQYEILKKRLAGIDPRVLERMRGRLRNAIGNEAAGVSASSAARLRRQNAPLAKQEEIMDKIATRRIGGVGDALTSVDEMNERYKAQAAGQFASFDTRSTEGQGFADLFGSGMNLLMNKPNNNFNPEFGYNMFQARKKAKQFENFNDLVPKTYNVDRYKSPWQ